MNKRKANGTVKLVGTPTYYGLVRRVARALKVSETYVSRIKAGKDSNERVAAAIEAARRDMDREAGR